MQSSRLPVVSSSSSASSTSASSCTSSKITTKSAGIDSKSTTQSSQKSACLSTHSAAIGAISFKLQESESPDVPLDLSKNVTRPDFHKRLPSRFSLLSTLKSAELDQDFTCDGNNDNFGFMNLLHDDKQPVSALETSLTESFTDAQFQNSNQSMAKRKTAEMESLGTPDSKKQNSFANYSASSSPSVGSSRKSSSKKKCSIENIVARIRIEKTGMETSSSKVIKCLDISANNDKAVEIKEEPTCEKAIENPVDLLRQHSQNIENDLPKADKCEDITDEQGSDIDTHANNIVAFTNIKEEFKVNNVNTSKNSSENGDLENSDRSINLDPNQTIVTKLDSRVKSLDKLQNKSNEATVNDLKVNNPKKRSNSSRTETDELLPKKKQKLQHVTKTKSTEEDNKRKISQSDTKGTSISKTGNIGSVNKSTMKSKTESKCSSDSKSGASKSKTGNISPSGSKSKNKWKTEINDPMPESPTKKSMNHENSEKLSPKKKTVVDKSDKPCNDANKTTKGSVNSNSDKETKLCPDSKQKKKNVKKTMSKKSKLSIACGRVKREASLNAATLVNILCEKAPRNIKLASKRSKSESDISKTPDAKLLQTVSISDIGFAGNLLGKERAFKSPKITKSGKILKDNLSKYGSPTRKVSFTDDIFDEVFEAVIQRGLIEGVYNNKESKKMKSSMSKQKHVSLIKTNTKSGEESLLRKRKGTILEKTCVKDKTLRLEKIRKAIKLTVNTRSPEEKEEVKRKASLARLARAKELLKTKKKLSAEYSDKSVDSDSEFESSESSETVDVEGETSTDAETIQRSKAKKGALCRSARTHVSVESKSVVENTMPSPRWCECCQSTYYPSQPTHGTQVWRIKQLVDKGTSKSPEPIQTSSHHFIAAHASCEVRPYTSPSHVSMLDSGPYMGQIVPHSHIQCSACHSGIFHASCQNCPLMSCQRYGNTYSVSYPHSHGSYIHCGCGSCYSSGSYHHTVGQALIHQSGMPISTESSLLLHHPLQPAVSITTLSHSHSEPPGMAHPMSVAQSLNTDGGRLQSSIPGSLPQCCQGDHNSFSRMCQLSQGEVTNVSVLASSSPTHSDHEFVDVGSRDDFLRSVSSVHLEQKSDHSAVQSISLMKKKKHSVKDPAKVKTNKKFVKTLSSTDKEKKRRKLEMLKLKAENLLSLKKKGEKVKSSKVTSGKSLKRKTNFKVPKDGEKETSEQTKEVKRPWHGWSWMGEGVVKSVTNIFDGQPITRKCYTGIVHEDGDIVKVKDCVLVCAGRRDRDLPFVAKITGFWEEQGSEEMMMSVLWYYRPEHAEGGRRPEHLDNEVFAAKHRDETGVACIEDKGYVLTYNEYCRYHAEVERARFNLPSRKAVVPVPEEPYPDNKIPPVDADPETVFLCRQVYDIKLKRVLKNPS
ncbi:uncharacterized protein LOC127873695 isoform X2 [Dreissena polymorpha]|nr:uncharacterized protein LOC127873695 isoform X2 [Dreissena polymorpha]XP_052273594.1 uncharacterized protein LOC127873695 isoform X2 [Dreissena polymorpha]